MDVNGLNVAPGQTEKTCFFFWVNSRVRDFRTYFVCVRLFACYLFTYLFIYLSIFFK